MARQTFERGTWLDPEELAYNVPLRSSRRRFRAIDRASGQLVEGRAGVADTFFSIPAMIGKRRGILFIGGIQQPNLDGVLTFGVPKAQAKRSPENPPRSANRANLRKNPDLFDSIQIGDR